MPRLGRKTKKIRVNARPTNLKGWQQVAEFLGQPTSVAQRWVRDGMPVQRQGRYVVATSDELNRWLGREAGGEPLHVATPEADLSAELKRGLAYLRGNREIGARNKPRK